MINKANLDVTDDKLIFDGIIEYHRFKQRRKIKLYKKLTKFEIEDSIFSAKTLTANNNFYLAPGLTIKANKICSVKHNKNIKVKSEQHNILSGYYYYSPAYGIKIEASKFVIRKKLTNKELKFKIIFEK